MKYPAIRTFSDIVNDLDQFDHIIDVRSPAEFALDHVPGAINCPVLDDAERVRIGTMYKQVNPFEAKKIGAALIAKNIAHHIEHQFAQHPREWKPLVYCWRGGNRSGAMALILAKIGWPVVQLDGGYKSYRNHINAQLAELVRRFKFRVICGTTGSGKSRLLQTLRANGAQVLDLEHLAAHRGSVLGDLQNMHQPAQKAFESAIWHTLRFFNTDQVVFVESESKKVGNLRVPADLMDCIRVAECINLQTPMPLRVALLMHEYAFFVQQPDELMKRLHYLTALHGKEKIRHWQDMVNQQQMMQVVRELLESHYDPAYLRSISRNFPQLSNVSATHLAGITESDFSALAHQLMA
jgi:tRNA 2-selenouridine synthase